MADQTLISSILNDDRPLALRRTRRRSTALPPNSSSHSISSVRQHGIHTPPSTPKRSSKRVRFSSPSTPTSAINQNSLHSSSSGLTPFINRATLGTPSRRHSTPSKLRNTRSRENIDSSPLSGTLQFFPLRQVLSGRVTRRLKRNKLSEEVNVIAWEKRQNAREKRSEIQRLREELARRDIEVGELREVQEVRSQIESEAGHEVNTNTELGNRLLDQEAEIIALRAELQKRENETREEEDEEEIDWTFAAKDPFDYDSADEREDDCMILTNYPSSPINSHNNIPNTPSRRNTNTSFPSPPSTSTNPNTPHSHIQTPLSFADLGTQAVFPDPENELLKSRLLDLETSIAKFTANSAFTAEHQERLLSKLCQYLPSLSSTPAIPDATPDHTTLDLTLDNILTTLFLSQNNVQESTNALTTLRSSITSLGFSSSPTKTLSLLASQFRAARLELEYLAPGENVAGFENGKLIGMLVDRVRYLSERVLKMDEHIDQYHEDEILLRQQLCARVSGMDEMRVQISDTDVLVEELREEIDEKEADNERLQTALSSYRTEVKDLEALVSHVEVEGKKKISASKKQHYLAITELEARLEVATCHASKLATELAAMECSRDEIVASTDLTIDKLQTSLLASQASVTQMQAQNYLSLQATVFNHEQALAARDTRIEELRRELEIGNRALVDAKVVVQSLLEQMMRTSEVALGFINGEQIPNGTEGGEGVRREGMLTGKPKRKGSVGASSERSKRRRYDSGLAFLDEQEEERDELAA